MMNIEKKCNRVISSCANKKQMDIASTFITLAAVGKKITYWEYKYWMGVMDGICHVNNWNKRT